MVERKIVVTTYEKWRLLQQFSH